MTDNGSLPVQAAVDHLNSQLPLKARQTRLSPSLRQLHRSILLSLAEQGRSPTQDDMADIVGPIAVEQALHTLAEQDLIVLNRHGEVMGAYPLTLEVTPHRILINGQAIYAMCALDAVSVAPLFKGDVNIDSRCHVTGESIQIRMQRDQVITATPSDPMIGIRWQMPCGTAAHSMCTEMVFFKDNECARRWQGEDRQAISLFTLHDAIAFGAAFFLPLLED